QCHFDYRESYFKKNPHLIITAVRFALKEDGSKAPLSYLELKKELGDFASVSAVRETVLRLRKKKGMVVDPQDPDSVSVGSFFINPVIPEEALRELEKKLPGISFPRYHTNGNRAKIPAAWTIEQVGFKKGFRYKNVGISSKHALALINFGGGNAEELLELAQQIQQKVFQQFGLKLIPEPTFLGQQNS
ncbi:MAG: UDP-N-acetylenolpyruvoylglucosamine reductase, partial [Pseudomonadota bacterium]